MRTKEENGEQLERSLKPVFLDPDLDSIRSVDSNPDSESGLGFRRAKKTHKNRKN
jgi:hypothetical protein